MSFDEFDFDNNELSDDDDFEDEEFDFDDDDIDEDDLLGDDDDYGFGDDDDFTTDDDFADDLDDGAVGMVGDEDNDFGEFDGAAGGPSRSFMIAIMAMMFIFVVGILIVVLLMLMGDGEISEQQKLATQIAMENSGTMTAYVSTQTQQAFERTQEAIAQETAAAGTAAADLQATIDAAASMTAAAVAELGMAQTAAALELEMAQTAAVAATKVALLEVSPVGGTENVGVLTDLEMQQTAWVNETLAAMSTPTPEEMIITQPPIDAINMTATAIVAGLNTPIMVPGEATPTAEDGFGIGGAATGMPPVPTAPATTLADTGLFDDVAGGTQGIAMMIVLSFSLIGLIMGTRMLRMANANSRPR